MKNGISLCMIVKNEENNLNRCLNSICDIVDEMIIVDTGSVDKTVSIAESFGAKVYHFPWGNSFSEARNESLKYAEKDWILIMDGDDELSTEDKETFLELINGSLDQNVLYFFETLNYCGNFPDSNNISINLNPRLFKNKHGFHYEGDVHNQLVNNNYSIKDVSVPVKIYHYGYLDNNIKGKNKRKRNISLLKEQLKNEPDNKYALFNLGNEYFALDNMKKALDYYYQSYEEFNPNSGYGFILVIRIVLANYYIKLYDKALEFAEIGLQYYPCFTDLYFFIAVIYKTVERPTLAIKNFEKCIEMGEAPIELKFLYGTGSFKALFELGNIYSELKDYHTAFQYFNDAIKVKPDFIVPVYRIAHILKEEKMPIVDLKSVIEKFFDDCLASYVMIADIFYSEGYYEAALEYIKKCEDSGMISEDIINLKVKVLVRTKAFEQCLNLSIDKESSVYFNISLCKVLSALLLNKQSLAFDILNSFKDSSLSAYNIKMLEVYTQFYNLMNRELAQVLSEDGNEKEYTAIIFEISEILLINKMFDEFELSLNLLNLISDKSVLLRLGKLYHNYGYLDMSRKELIRSIKEFEVFDAETLHILKQEIN